MVLVRRVAIGIGCLAAWTGFIALGVAARDGHSPWQWIFWALIIPLYAWITFEKLTSDQAVDTTFYDHFRFSVVAVGSLVYGLIVLIDDSWSVGRWTTPVGLLCLAAGIVMFAAEVRDSMHTGTGVQQYPEEPADPPRAADEPPRRRAW